MIYDDDNVRNQYDNYDDDDDDDSNARQCP